MKIVNFYSPGIIYGNHFAFLGMFQGDRWKCRITYDALRTPATKNCREKHKLRHGEEMYFARYFSWCGHVARMTAIEPMSVRAQQHGAATQSIHGLEVGTGSGSVCRHRMDKSGTGSRGVALKD